MTEHPEARSLHALFDEEWEWTMKEFPTVATSVGDPRYNGRWPDYSLEAHARREAHARDLLRRVSGIDRSRLPENDQLNYDLFRREVELWVEGLRFHEEYMPINQMTGAHQEVAEIMQIAPRAKAKDYDDIVQRLEGVPLLIDQTIELMRKGIECALMPPRIILQQVASLIGSQVVDDPARSPLSQILLDGVPSDLSTEERSRIRDAVQGAIRGAVVPGYRKLGRFFTEEYEPKARATIGLSDLPDGADWYAFRIRMMTTTELTADAIHELGHSEVQRIDGEMEAIKEKAGFTGTLAEFFNHLRTDPRFFFTDKNALLITYRDIAKRIDPELPKLFRTLPRLPYGVLPVPAYSEKVQTTAYYHPGSLDAGRPGYFFANTYDLPSRPRWEMEALTAHEAVPGHHLQIALAEELKDLPKFRRFGGNTAYVEGWGLYSESLGEQLGLYTDPHSKFGQLTYEMWRAIRLVVDTGMHAKGWSRDQAIAFFEKHAGKASHDIAVEVDRYIAWPAQALAYKIGELKIKELRAGAAAALGDRFDIRDFHDAILGAGPLPLTILENRVKAWADRTRK